MISCCYNPTVRQGWEEAKHSGARYEREYCWDNFLSANTLQVSQSDLAVFLVKTLLHVWVASCLARQGPAAFIEAICLFVFQMLHNMKGQFAEHLMHTGFISSRDPKDPKSNVNSGN